MQEFWNTGVLTAKTRCWAQGMDGWRPLQAIPQLKWCLLATGQAVMNESDLATLILNMLITMCSYYPSRWESLSVFQWLFVFLTFVITIIKLFIYFVLRDQDNAIIRPLPKIKRMITDNACLPHIVQVIVQFVSDICSHCCAIRSHTHTVKWHIDGLLFFFLVLSSCC